MGIEKNNFTAWSVGITLPLIWRSRQTLWRNEKMTQMWHPWSTLACLLEFKTTLFSFFKSPHSNQGGHHPWSKLLAGHRNCQYRSQFHFPWWSRLCSTGRWSSLQGNCLSLFCSKISSLNRRGIFVDWLDYRVVLFLILPTPSFVQACCAAVQIELAFGRLGVITTQTSWLAQVGDGVLIGQRACWLMT